MQVKKLMSWSNELDFQSPLVPDKQVFLFSAGFAQIVDYCLAVSLFPNKTAFEELASKNRALFPALEDVYDKIIYSHYKSDAMKRLENAWIDFVKDKAMTPFARKPVFPRIGFVGISKRTSMDIANEMGREDDSEGFSDSVCPNQTVLIVKNIIRT